METIKGKDNTEQKKYKEYQIDYLQIFNEELDTNGNVISNYPVDISGCLEKCLTIDPAQRIKKHKGEIIRLQYLEKIDNLEDNLEKSNNIWLLHFIRIKVNMLSAIATNDGKFSETLLDEKLEKNQHLAETTGCLYDADNNLLIVARNRDGVMPSVILEFVRSMSNNKHLNFGVIPNEVNVKSKNVNIYRRLIIGMKDINNMGVREMNILKNIPSVFGAIKSFQGYGYYNIKIELSMGSAPKYSGMNSEKLKDTSLKLMESDLPNISKLEIASKEDTDSNIETIDLLNNKIKDNINIGYTRSNPVSINKIKNGLLNSYDKKKSLIESIIR